MNKKFPQTKLQEEIWEFWKVRGYNEIHAILGNLNVSFHKSNPKYESLGLNYQYLEQFYKKAQQEIIKDMEKIIVKQLNTCILIRNREWEKNHPNSLRCKLAESNIIQFNMLLDEIGKKNG